MDKDLILLPNVQHRAGNGTVCPNLKLAPCREARQSLLGFKVYALASSSLVASAPRRP